MATQVTHPKFTVNEYRLLFEVGVFAENRRVELIDGELSEMSPIGGQHMRCIALINRLLLPAIGDRAYIHIQGSAYLGENSEPEPDVSIVWTLPEGNEPPRPDDILLLIEVAESSLAYDRDVKAPVYAAAGIPEYWIADINHRQIIQHRRPTSTGYEQVDILGMGERIVAEQLPEIDIAVADVFA